MTDLPAQYARTRFSQFDLAGDKPDTSLLRLYLSLAERESVRNRILEAMFGTLAQS